MFLRYAQNEIFHPVGIFLCFIMYCGWYSLDHLIYINACDTMQTCFCEEMLESIRHQLKRNCSPYFYINVPFRFGSKWLLALVCLMVSSIQVSLLLSDFTFTRGRIQWNHNWVPWIVSCNEWISFCMQMLRVKRRKCFQLIDCMVDCSYIPLNFNYSLSGLYCWPFKWTASTLKSRREKKRLKPMFVVCETQWESRATKRNIDLKNWTKLCCGYSHCGPNMRMDHARKSRYL